MGDILVGLGVEHLEVTSLAGELREMGEGDVARRLGVVEAAVRVFLDNYGRSARLRCHGHGCAPRFCCVAAMLMLRVVRRNIAIQRTLRRCRFITPFADKSPTEPGEQ